LEFFKPSGVTKSKTGRELSADLPSSLAAAEEKFRLFLSAQNYPPAICWIREGDLLVDRTLHFWVRERGLKEANHAARRYLKGLERNVGVELRAICSTEERAFASVFVPADDLDAQQHLIGRGLKLSCPTERYATSTVKNPLHWLALWLRYWRPVAGSRFPFD
jgi:hypothetical protein